MCVQVAYFFLVLIILLTIKHVQHTGWLQTLQTFAPVRLELGRAQCVAPQLVCCSRRCCHVVDQRLLPLLLLHGLTHPHTPMQAWFTQIVWMSALRAPSFWETNRLPLLLLIKLKIALQTVHANNSIIDLLYVDKGLAPLAPPTATLLYKTVLVTGVAHFPAMSVCMRLPFLLQLGYLMFLGTSLFLSASPRGGCCVGWVGTVLCVHVHVCLHVHLCGLQRWVVTKPAMVCQVCLCWPIGIAIVMPSSLCPLFLSPTAATATAFATTTNATPPASCLPQRW